MDALDRLLPVARPLLQDVDTILMTRGAPGDHAVLRLLGLLGGAPTDVLESVAGLEPARLREAGATLRRAAQTYGLGSLPPASTWDGEAARHYAAAVSSLNEHLAGDGPSSMAVRLRDTASFVEDVARWQQELRDDMAGMLARVMTSAEAVTLCTGGVADAGALTAQVSAAADIATALLRVAEEAAARAEDLVRAAGGLDELPYHPPATANASRNGPIRMF